MLLKQKFFLKEICDKPFSSSDKLIVLWSAR